MCPICLTSLAITVATTTGAGAAVTAVAVRVTRSLTHKSKPETRTLEPEDNAQERNEPHRQP